MEKSGWGCGGGWSETLALLSNRAGVKSESL